MYSDGQRRLAVACVQRYGLRPAARMLREVWDSSPAQSSLQLWAADPDCAPTPRARQRAARKRLM